MPAATVPAPVATAIAGEKESDHDYDIDDDDDEVLEDNISVYEKKFNKKPYYVSDDDRHIIYEMLPDGGIGKEVGHCVKDAGGKLKPVWN